MSAAGLVLCLFLIFANAQSNGDLLRPVPAQWADTPVVLLKDNLAVIPGEWDSVSLCKSSEKANVVEVCISTDMIKQRTLVSTAIRLIPQCKALSTR